MRLVARGTEPGQQRRRDTELLQPDQLPSRLEQDSQRETQTLYEVVHSFEGGLVCQCVCVFVCDVVCVCVHEINYEKSSAFHR